MIVKFQLTDEKKAMAVALAPVFGYSLTPHDNGEFSVNLKGRSIRLNEYSAHIRLLCEMAQVAAYKAGLAFEQFESPLDYLLNYDRARLIRRLKTNGDYDDNEE